LLQGGKFVLVFPEESVGELDHQTKTRPFLKGFTRMGELFFEKTGKSLNFYPIANHGSNQVMVGVPICFNPDNPRGLERRRLKRGLENRIKSMYLKMDQGES